MKKNIAIILLSITSFTSIVWVIYEKTISADLQIVAERAAAEAIKQEAIAKKNEVMAVANAAEAVRQAKVAEEAVRNCQSKNK